MSNGDGLVRLTLSHNHLDTVIWIWTWINKKREATTIKVSASALLVTKEMIMLLRCMMMLSGKI